MFGGDPALDRIAFNIREKDVVFSITSGGCNVLSFLIDNPGKIIALDLNPYQNYLLELKIAALKMLNYVDMLKFLGVESCKNRQEFYVRVKSTLGDEARNYWDRKVNSFLCEYLCHRRMNLVLHLQVLGLRMNVLLRGLEARMTHYFLQDGSRSIISYKHGREGMPE